MKQHENKFAWTVKIGERGQFVIPKEARELFNIHPGDTVLVLGDAERGLAIPTRQVQDEFIAKLFSQLRPEE